MEDYQGMTRSEKLALDAYHLWYTGIIAQYTELGSLLDEQLCENAWYRIWSALRNAVVVLRNSPQLA